MKMAFLFISKSFQKQLGNKHTQCLKGHIPFYSLIFSLDNYSKKCNQKKSLCAEMFIRSLFILLKLGNNLNTNYVFSVWQITTQKPNGLIYSHYNNKY